MIRVGESCCQPPIKLSSPLPFSLPYSLLTFFLLPYISLIVTSCPLVPTASCLSLCLLVHFKSCGLSSPPRPSNQPLRSNQKPSTFSCISLLARLLQVLWIYKDRSSAAPRLKVWLDGAIPVPPVDGSDGIVVRHRVCLGNCSLFTNARNQGTCALLPLSACS